MDLGNYRLIAELARGGMGIVHLAEARGPGGFEKLVVVKELKPELADDPVYTAMFLDEARLGARLSHRNIVRTNEVGCEDGRYFMALELLEGGSLHQLRGKVGLSGLPLHLGLRVLIAVCDALHYAHELADAEGRSLGIVHRDVSPQNIFVTFDGDVKLIDFGVAKSKDSPNQTKVGVVKGSIPYMSPDHLDGSSIDRRADVFAVGVLLRELVTGERLWGDADELTILRRLIARDVPAFPASSDVPEALRAIVERAMAKVRADRFPTARALREALEAHLATDPGGSLEELGVWLARTLKAERDAFRALVRRGRATTAAPAPVWLASSELHTRVSIPRLPANKPSRRAPRSRSLLSGGLFAAALVLAAAFGFVERQPTTTATTSTERAPRVVEETSQGSLTTSAIAEATPVAPATPVVEEPATTPQPRAAVDPPAEIQRETVPPNPYDPR